MIFYFNKFAILAMANYGFERRLWKHSCHVTEGDQTEIVLLQ